MVLLIVVIDLIGHLWILKYDWGRRWLGGDPMRGKRKTDSTFWARAETDVGRNAKTFHWWRLAGWERAAVRVLSFPHLFCLWLYGEAVEPAITHLAMWALVAASLLAGLLWLRGWREEHEIAVRVLRPLDAALRPVIKIPVHQRTKQWISADADLFSNPAAKVVLLVPPGYVPDDAQRKDLSNRIAEKLGGDFNAVFHLAALKPSIDIVHVAQPPDKVPYSIAKHHLENRPKGHFLLGFGPAWLPIYWEWANAATAHLLVSLWTGGGKSMLLADLITQALHDGWRVIIIDGKHVSQKWAKKLDGVTYARTDTEIEAAFIALKGMVQARYQRLDDDDPATFQEVLVVIEEMNATKAWLQLLHRGRGGRYTSPAVQAIQELAFTARAAGVHLATVAQLATANSMGGSEVRENYALRLVNSRTSFKILAPDITDPPAGLTRSGYMFLIRDAQYWALQAVLWAEKQLQHYATSGIPQPETAEQTPPDGPDTGERLIEAAQQALPVPHDRDSDTRDVPNRPRLTLVPPVEDVRTYRQWWEALRFSDTYQGALQLRTRDQDKGCGPVVHHAEGRSYCYTAEAIDTWLRERTKHEPARDPRTGRYLSKADREAPPIQRRIILEKEYGPAHRALALRLRDEFVEGQICPLCYAPMFLEDLPDAQLAHDESDPTHMTYLGLAHGLCNMREGGKIGAARKKELTNRFPDSIT